MKRNIANVLIDGRPDNGEKSEKISATVTHLPLWSPPASASELSASDNNIWSYLQIYQQHGISFTLGNRGICPRWVWFPPHPSRIVPSTTADDEVGSARIRRGAVEGMEETGGRRRNNFWIIKGNYNVRFLMYEFVSCRRSNTDAN